MIEVIKEHFDFSKSTITKKVLLFIALSIFVFGYVYVFGSVYDRPKNGEYYLPEIMNVTDAVDENTVITQTFVSPVDKIRSLWLYYDASEMQYPAMYIVKLYEDGELIQVNDFTTDKGSPRNIILTPFSGAKDKEYTLEISLGRTTAQSYTRFFTQNRWTSAVGGMRIGDVETGDTLAVQINNGATGHADTYIVLIFLSAALILGITVLFGKNVHFNTFMFICAVGLFISVLNPVGDVPDEKAHMQRAETLSQGVLFGTATLEYEADSTLQELFSMGSQQSNTFARFSDANLYSNKMNSGSVTTTAGTAGNYFFIGYMATAMGLKIGHMLNMSAMLCVYLCRFLNIVLYAAICTLAVAVVPGYKKLFSFIACLPNSLFLAASFSPDGITIGLFLLAVALFMRMLCYEDGSLTVKDTALWLLLTTVAAITRIPYLVTILLILMVPKAKYKDNKNQISTYALLAVFTALALVWTAVSGLGGLREIGGASASGQLMFMLQNPAAALAVIFGTMISEIYVLYSGMYLIGWNTYSISWVGVVLPFVIYSIAQQERKLQISDIISKKKIISVLFCVYMITYLGMYISSNVVGASVIIGIQGRYFLECFAFIPLLLAEVGKEKKSWYLNSKYWNLFLAMVLISTIVVRNYM